MPITKIIIENFKGIRDRVEIPIRPLTLLFGANSAGKSTILQALLYLRELMEGRNPDADRLLAGGNGLDLGGFQEFVHGRKTENKICIGIELRLDEDGLPQFSPARTEEPGMSCPAKVLDSVQVVALEVKVEWSHEYRKAFVTSYAVSLDGVSFTSSNALPSSQAGLDYVNSEHPIFSTPAIDADGSEYPSDLLGALESTFPQTYRSDLPLVFQDKWAGVQRILMGHSVIPNFSTGLPDSWSYPPSEGDEFDNRWIYNILNRAMTGVGRLVLGELHGIRYIGPIRVIPKRNFQPLRSPGEDRWSDGSGAWDLLGTEDANHDWLNPKTISSLGLGLGVECHSFFEVPKLSGIGMAIESGVLGTGEFFLDLDTIPASDFQRVREKSRIQLVSEATGLEMQPCEVGIGVSQILPVAIGAMAPGYKILAVEQPELHIHPAVQCNLGDLLISQVVGGNDRTILLETHSEHLILRMLRRIRENTEGERPPDAPMLTPEHLSVLWVEQDNGVVSIKPIPVNSQGDFDEQWPKGFFEERANELF